AVPALAGIPLTHRGVTQDVAIVSAHLDPSHPGATVDWDALAKGPGTLVLLMAVTHLERVAQELVKRGRAEGTPVAVISDGPAPQQPGCPAPAPPARRGQPPAPPASARPGAGATQTPSPPRQSSAQRPGLPRSTPSNHPSASSAARRCSRGTSARRYRPSTA